MHKINIKGVDKQEEQLIDSDYTSTKECVLKYKKQEAPCNMPKSDENLNNKFWNKRRKIVISGLIFSSLLTILAKQDLKPLLDKPDIAKWYAIIIVTDNIKWAILAYLYIIYVTIQDISFEKIKVLLSRKS